MTDTRHPTAPHSPRTAKPKPPAPALPPIQPFRPHRKLFITIGFMLFAWLAVLLVLYFTTVYPYRHSRVEYPGESLPTTPAPTPANP